MQFRRMIIAAVSLAVVSFCSFRLVAAEEHAAPAGEGSHAEHAAHGEHGGHGEHIGLADADLGTITKPEEIRSDLAVWTFVVFVLLLAILWKFAWGPIVAGLEKREESIAHNIDEAKRQNDEARQLLADYETKLAGAADQVRGIMEDARRDAEHAKQAIIAEAKSAAEGERLRGLRDIESATDAALQSLAERSAQLAVELAGKIVHSSLNAKDHAKLIQEAVAKFPSSPSNN